MKKIISLVLCVLFLFPMGLLVVSAKSANTLWKDRQNYKYSAGEVQFMYLFSYYTRVVTGEIFFYTDTAAEMKFELSEDFENGPQVNYSFQIFLDWCDASEYVIRNEKLDEILLKYHKKWEKPEHFSNLQPMLWAVIHELSIPKEELIRANERMKNDPYSIREIFPNLTDEEIRCCFVGRYLDDFLIDALYVEDEETARNLLCTPWSIRIDGIAYTLPQLTLFLEDQQKYFYETLAPEQLKAVDQYALYYFLEYCKDLLENKPSYVQEFGKEKTEQALNTLSAYYQNDLPETGDNTPIFLTLTALSVFGLVALAVTVGRKKKERL